MAELAGWGLGYHGPALQLIRRELGRCVARGTLRQFTEIDDPLADLCQRYAHQPAAALARAASQRDHCTKCHQIAGAIVDRRHWIELRSWRLAGYYFRL